MPTTIAEYLGQDITQSNVVIPADYVNGSSCPFMNDYCIKVKKKDKPICSVRNSSGVIWIVCPNRLCATKSKIPLSTYQISILKSVADVAFKKRLSLDQVLVKREQSIKVSDNSSYHADYIISAYDGICELPKYVLEMQGGGETSSTGSITRHVDAWEKNSKRTNGILGEGLSKPNPIVTNAWRRQQEQFFLKGNISANSGGGIIFCVGELLYDYLLDKLRGTKLPDLRKTVWDLAIIGFKESNSGIGVLNSLKLEIDSNRIIYTKYHSFVRAIADQGHSQPDIFEGTYLSLTGKSVRL